MADKTFDKQPLVEAILDALRDLPSGTDVSTSDMLDRIYEYKTYEDGVYFFKDLQINTEEFFEIDLRVRKQASKHNLILDDSKSAGLVLGLPFHIPYTVKHRNK